MLLLFVGVSVTGVLTLIDALDVLVLRVGVLVFVKIVLPIFSADLLVCIGIGVVTFKDAGVISTVVLPFIDAVFFGAGELRLTDALVLGVEALAVTEDVLPITAGVLVGAGLGVLPVTDD